jgi:hypothetical protein
MFILSSENFYRHIKERSSLKQYTSFRKPEGEIKKQNQ